MSAAAASFRLGLVSEQSAAQWQPQPAGSLDGAQPLEGSRSLRRLEGRAAGRALPQPRGGPAPQDVVRERVPRREGSDERGVRTAIKHNLRERRGRGPARCVVYLRPRGGRVWAVRGAVGPVELGRQQVGQRHAHAGHPREQRGRGSAGAAGQRRPRTAHGVAGRAVRLRRWLPGSCGEGGRREIPAQLEQRRADWVGSAPEQPACHVGGERERRALVGFARRARAAQRSPRAQKQRVHLRKGARRP